MPLKEVEYLVRAVIYTPKEENAKADAADLEDVILMSSAPYEIRVLPFNPASHDFSEKPFSVVANKKTIGEIYQQEMIQGTEL